MTVLLAFGCLGGRQVGHDDICGPADLPGNCVPQEAQQHLDLQLCLLLCHCQEAFQPILSHSQFSGSHTDGTGVAKPNTRLYHTPRSTSPHVRQSSNSHPSVAHTCGQGHKPPVSPLEESCTNQDDAQPSPSRKLLQAPRSGVEDSMLTQSPCTETAKC